VNLRLGYNTNGFAHHRLKDAIAILAELGYESIALTLDHHALNPFDADWQRQAAVIRGLLERHRLTCVVETGARFLLDPRRKHQPTLLSPEAAERERRFDFLRRSIDVAAELGAQAVSSWSGTAASDEPEDVLFARLAEGCRRLCAAAEAKRMPLAFEPEPGMVIDTMAKFARLHKAVADPLFGLTIDIGHLHCMGETPIADHLRKWGHLLRNVHIEDMRQGVHEHLMFGEGEIDFPPVLRALQEIGYAGGVHVELSRHSHDAVKTARQALAFLRGVQ
jgi:sugar phosphate isomerase/epimerase